jgi:hypothetical protein
MGILIVWLILRFILWGDKINTFYTKNNLFYVLCFLNVANFFDGVTTILFFLITKLDYKHEYNIFVRSILMYFNFNYFLLYKLLFVIILSLFTIYIYNRKPKLNLCIFMINIILGITFLSCVLNNIDVIYIFLTT